MTQTIRKGYDPTPFHLELERIAERQRQEKEANEPRIVLPGEWPRIERVNHIHWCNGCRVYDACDDACAIVATDDEVGAIGKDRDMCSKCNPSHARSGVAVQKATHFHACPDCYDHWPCALDCTIEPDLSEESPHGSYAECPKCAYARAVRVEWATVRHF